MQRKFLLYAIILIGTSVTGSAQTNFNWGPELGFTTCGFNQTTSETSYFDVTTYTSLPTKSILLGINTQLDIKKHFNINVGLRFQTIGETYESVRTGKMYVSDDETANHITTSTTEQLYQKIALPISFGFQFHIGNIATNLFVGYNQNYILNGSYIETNQRDCEVDAYDFQYTTSQNPFAVGFPVNHFNSQLNTGVSFTYKNSIVLKADANFGGYLSFADPSPYYFCAISFGGLQNKDYTLSVSYLF